MHFACSRHLYTCSPKCVRLWEVLLYWGTHRKTTSREEYLQTFRPTGNVESRIQTGVILVHSLLLNEFTGRVVNKNVYLIFFFFRTRLTQDAVIKVFGISFKDYCESLIKSTMASNASKVCTPAVLLTSIIVGNWLWQSGLCCFAISSLYEVDLEGRMSMLLSCCACFAFFGKTFYSWARRIGEWHVGNWLVIANFPSQDEESRCQ